MWEIFLFIYDGTGLSISIYLFTSMIHQRRMNESYNVISAAIGVTLDRLGLQNHAKDALHIGWVERRRAEYGSCRVSIYRSVCIVCPTASSSSVLANMMSPVRGIYLHYVPHPYCQTVLCVLPSARVCTRVTHGLDMYIAYKYAFMYIYCICMKIQSAVVRLCKWWERETRVWIYITRRNARHIYIY